MSARQRLSRLIRHHLFWPAVVLVVLLAANVGVHSNFLSIRLQDGHLYGSLIDIFRQGTPLILVALGMTIVIATSGIDLSVGSVMAISGALACYLVDKLDNQNSVTGVLMAVSVALALSLALGAVNGMLVTTIGIQPIIATLILMVSGRGVAQLITDGQIINVRSSPYRTIGAGYLLTVPVCVVIAAVVVAASAALIRRTALGMFIEAVGGSPTASRLAGVRSRQLILLAYVFSGLCAGIAGLIFSSNVNSADGNNAGDLIELDAILAVVIGGTSLLGGRFSIAGSVLGAVIIKTLDITVVSLQIPSDSKLLFKAIVVIILCVSQSPAFRAKVFQRRRHPSGAPPTPQAPSTPQAPPKAEVPA